MADLIVQLGSPAVSKVALRRAQPVMFESCARRSREHVRRALVTPGPRGKQEKASDQVASAGEDR